jgi:hypothetical protein
MTVWCTRIACWIPQATDTHSEYVILIVALLLQQWLHERALMLRYMHTACLVNTVRNDISVPFCN